MEDVTQQTISRDVTVQRVGAKDLHSPVPVRRRKGRQQAVLGAAVLAARRPEQEHGPHMSRLVDLLYHGSPGSEGIRQIRSNASPKLRAPSSRAATRLRRFAATRAHVGDAGKMPAYERGFEACASGDRNQRAVVSCRLAHHVGNLVWLGELVEALGGYPDAASIQSSSAMMK
jgi:GTP cyclohydrolase FolE2